jgi:cobalamin synthase
MPEPALQREPKHRARYAGWLPLAGMVLVALPACLVYAFFVGWLPHALAVLTAMATMLFLGRASHELGLASWADRNLAAPTPFAGVGARGSVAIVMLIAFRLEALSTLDPSWIATALLCGAGVSRALAVLVAASLPARAAMLRLWPEAEPGVTGSSGQEARIGPVAVIWAICCGALPVIAAILWTGLWLPFALAGSAALVVAAWMRRRLKRFEASMADPATPGALRLERALGSTQTMSELAFYLGIIGALSLPLELPGEQPW